ncbi:ABC transporter ATP-binding protein [Desulfotruncus alcoholivorax]|uniref:ABC transporter ATP-binding protein n=1 Tax=Desulfotruncus alcoholivorax TaxID=265477 RepID=UPI0004858307|nr:ABC transporter ATP-binding protein [Desulfotruncus alcoholivorax]
MISEVLVRMQNLSRTYWRGKMSVQALVDATGLVRPGDRIALVGPSGSGKSTLLQLMAGLDKPTDGEITWPVLDELSGLLPRQVSVVFQMPSLLPPLSVLENVELPMLLGDASVEEARQTAREMLDIFNLHELADKLPEELSGGQAQRVAMARALACRPQLLLADEPTGQLDRHTARHMFDVLFNFLQGSGTALVVATHDPAVAERLAVNWRMQHGVLEVS